MIQIKLSYLEAALAVLIAASSLALALLYGRGIAMKTVAEQAARDACTNPSVVIVNQDSSLTYNCEPRKVLVPVPVVVKG